MRIDGGSGRKAPARKAPARKAPARKTPANKKKAAKLIEDIGKLAVRKTGDPKPERQLKRVTNFEKAMRPKAGPPAPKKVLENERAKGESKVKPRILENERARRIKAPVLENERGKADIRRQLTTLLDKRQPTAKRADALTKLQSAKGSKYQLPKDSVLHELATRGEPKLDKDAKLGVSGTTKGGKKGPGTISKLTYALPIIGPTRVAIKGMNKAVDVAVPVLGKAIKRTIEDDLKALGAVREVADRLVPDVGPPQGLPKEAKRSKAGLDFPEPARDAIERGALAAGGPVIKGLSAPVAASEAAIGKGLVAVGAGNEKLKRAPGPIKAFKKTLKKGITPDQITGADLAESVGLSRKLGLPIDLAVDPLMYGGIALAPATGGGSAVALAARIQQRLRTLAPEVFRTPEVQRALREFRTTQDADAFVKKMEDLAPADLIETARKEQTRKAIKESLAVRDATKGTITARERRTIRDLAMRRPGKLVEKDATVPVGGADVAAATLRAGASRERSPVIGLQLLKPTGAKADINISLGGKQIVRQGNIPLLPVGKLPLYSSQKRYLQAITRERAQKLAVIDNKVQQHIKEIEKQISAVQKTPNSPARQQKLLALDNAVADARRLAHEEKSAKGLLAGQDYAPDVRRSYLTTVADRVRERNIRVAQVDATRVNAADIGRMTGRRFEKLYEQSLSPLKSIKDAAERSKSAQRVQLYREMVASTDGVARERAEQILQLTPDEKLAARNLDVVNAQELTHAQNVGLFNHGWDGYVGQRIWLGANDSLVPQEQIDKMIGRPIPSSGSVTAAQKQRSAQSLFDVADPDQMAGIIESLARAPGDYRAIADELHQQGTARTIHELMARRFQRTGTPLMADELTDVERRTLTRDASLAPDKDLPLWHDLDDPSAEGQVLPANWDKYGMEEDPYASINDPDQRRLRKLADAIIDRREVRARLKTDPDNEAMQAWAARLDNEIHELDPAPPVMVDDLTATAHEKWLLEQNAREGYQRFADLKLKRDQIEREMDAWRAADASNEYAPTGDTRGRGVQYHGTPREIDQIVPGYENEQNIYGSYDVFYTTDAWDIVHGPQGYAGGGPVYKVDFLGRADFPDELHDLHVELDVLTDDLKASIKHRDELYEHYDDATRANDAAQMDEIHRLLDDNIVERRTIDAERRQVQSDLRDALRLWEIEDTRTPTAPNLYDLDETIYSDELLKELRTAGLTDESEIVRRLGPTNNPFQTSLRSVLDELRADGIRPATYNEDLRLYSNWLWDYGFDGWTHVGGRITGRQPHNVEIYFKAYQTLKLTPVKPVPGTAEYDAMTDRLIELQRQAHEAEEAAELTLVQVPMPRPELDGFDTIVLDHYGAAWITGRNTAATPPEIQLRSRDGIEPGPFEDILRKSDADPDYLDRRDPMSALVESLDWDFGETNPLGKLEGIEEKGAKLPDFRSGQPGISDLRRESGLVPELHPRIVGHVRSRATGMATANQVRYDAITKAVGRNSDETRGTYYHRELDEEGPLSDLSPIFDQDGKIVGYRHNVKSEGTDEVIYEASELDFPTPGLVTTSDKAGDYWDPMTGARYRHPHQTFGTTLMGQNIKESTLWPSQYIDELAASSKAAGEYDQVFDTVLQSMTGQIMSTLRFGVTVPFPAYHVRNMASDLVKSLQADSGVLFHPAVNAKLTAAAFGRGLDRTIPVPGFGDMVIEDFLLMADLFGVRSGQQVSDFAEAFSTGAITDAKVSGLLKKTGASMSDFSAHREDVVRYMTFLQRMRVNGGDPADAAWYMTRHHFNYNDLSNTERRVMRNLFLFYTWFRKNIPLQLMELGRRPGFFSGAMTTYRDLEAGETPLNAIPGLEGPAPNQRGTADYVFDRLQSFVIPVNGKAVNVSWGAPWSDLGLLATGDNGEDLFNAIMSMGNPIVVQAYTQLTQREPLTGRTYEQDEPGGAVSVIDTISRALGGEGLIRDKDDRPVLDWRVAAALRNLPFLGRATASLGATPDTRDPGKLQRYGQLAAPITGLNIHVAPKKGTPQEKKAVENYLKGLVSERRTLLSNMNKLKDSADPRAQKLYGDRIKKLDAEIAEKAAGRGILRELKATDNAGYKSRKRSGGRTSGRSSGRGGARGGLR